MFLAVVTPTPVSWIGKAIGNFAQTAVRCSIANPLLCEGGFVLLSSVMATYGMDMLYKAYSNNFAKDVKMTKEQIMEIRNKLNTLSIAELRSLLRSQKVSKTDFSKMKDGDIDTILTSLKQGLDKMAFELDAKRVVIDCPKEDLGISMNLLPKDAGYARRVVIDGSEKRGDLQMSMDLLTKKLARPVSVA